jgi:PPK2 family polyphosphate:nucleotide phosphotransferase
MNNGGKMDKYRVKPGEKVNLKDWDPNDTSEFKGSKAEGLAKNAKLNVKLEELQGLLYAEHKHKLLVVLQGTDTAGKDGVISKVFDGVNPQGVRVASFKVPTQEELDHDYLWRIHKQVPGKGEMVIFNRSHYEDVLVVRVHKLVTPQVCKERYKQISDFEKTLADNGTTILKFFLNIDLDEQKQRLQERLDDPTKTWKFNPGDLEERKLWPDYMKAYEDAIQNTSTEKAPWYIVPANKKWYRDVVISTVLVNTLEKMNMQYPAPAEGLKDIVIV